MSGIHSNAPKYYCKIALSTIAGESLRMMWSLRHVLHDQDDDSWFGVDSKTSTRFDSNFSITDFLKINLGTEVALPLVSGEVCRGSDFGLVIRFEMLE